MYKILILLMLVMGNLYASDDKKNDDPFAFSKEDRERAMDRQKEKKKNDDVPQPKIGSRKKFKAHTIHDKPENQRQPRSNRRNRKPPYKRVDRKKPLKELKKNLEEERKRKEEETKKLEKKMQKNNL